MPTEPPATPPGSLLDDNLPVHPRVRRTDVIVAARLREGDGLRLALLQYAGIPFGRFLLRCGVGDIADIREGYACSRLDPRAPRPIPVLLVAVADLYYVGPLRDRSGRASNVRGRGRRPQWTQLSFQRERPNGVAVGSAAKRVAARSDRDILVAIKLKEDGRSIGAEPRLEAPQHLAGLGVDRQKDSLPVIIPRNDKAVVPISPERVRRLRKHLVLTLRALRTMKGPEHSVSPLRPEPEGFAGHVARTACSLCKGWCCRNGEDHAFLDEGTIARVRCASLAMIAGAKVAHISASISFFGHVHDSHTIELRHVDQTPEIWPAPKRLTVCSIRTIPQRRHGARSKPTWTPTLRALSRDHEADRMIADMDARRVDPRQQIERLKRYFKSRKPDLS